jgi:hypothetical protein
VVPRKRVVKRGVFLTAWLEEEHVALLDRIARAEGISRSELLRRIIVEWLESPEVKARYGLQVVFEEQVAKTSTARLLPLTEKRLRDLDRALGELERVIGALARELPRKMELARALAATRDELLRIKREAGYVKIRGEVVPAERYWQEWWAQHGWEFRLLEGALEEWRRARRLFFGKVYYPWLRGLRKEVPVDVMVRYEQRIALLLRKVDEVEPLAGELERLLRPREGGSK